MDQEKTPTTSTQQILMVMRILTWIAFIGLMIKTGAVLISYGVSWFNPDAAKNLYKGLDLYGLRQFDFWHYSASVSFIAAIPAMKAVVLFLVIRALSKVNLATPFSREIARNLESISAVLVGICVVSILSNAHHEWLMKRTAISLEPGATGEFLFIAGLVFIISQVFKRGVEIQSENELTV